MDSYDDETTDGQAAYPDDERRRAAPASEWAPRTLSLANIESARRVIASMTDQIDAARGVSALMQWTPPRIQVPALDALTRMSRTLTGPSFTSAQLHARHFQRLLQPLSELVHVLAPFDRHMAATDTFPIAEILRAAAAADLMVTSLARTRIAPLAAVTATLTTALDNAAGSASRVIDPEAVEVEPTATEVGELDRLGAAATGTGAGLAVSGELAHASGKDIELPVGLVASGDLRLAMRERLTRLHAELPEKLDGAWQRIIDGGPDAAGQAATSLVEVIDWTLRLLGPDEAVLHWHAAEGLPEQNLVVSGRPTRALRIRYVVRDRPHDARVVDLYVKALTMIVDLLQGGKHQLGSLRTEGLEPIVVQVEAILLFMTVDNARS